MSQGPTKRQKFVTIEVALNTARFQNLLLSDGLQDVKLGLEFASECNYKLDNSRLYGVQEIHKNHSMFELWIQICHKTILHPLDDKIVRDIFDILLKTGARNDINFSFNGRTKNMFEFTEKFNDPHLILFDCLISQMALFGVRNILCSISTFEKHNNKQSQQLIVNFIQRIIDIPVVYSRLNRITFKNGTICFSLFNAIKNSKPFSTQILCQCLPIVELDLFIKSRSWCKACKKKKCMKHNYWYCIENAMIGNVNVELQGIIRASREILEDYREKRNLLVNQEVSFLSKNLIGIINEYGKRFNHEHSQT